MAGVFSTSAAADKPHAAARYLDSDACAARYGISSMTWRRMVDSGRAPQPTRFGRCVRWAVATLEEWEAAGCKAVRPVGKGGGR